MHTVIRRYRIEDGDMDELLHRVDADFADGLSHEPGFIAYECIRISPEELVTISTFADEAGCERSSQLATAFVRDQLSDMSIARIGATTGDVAVSRAAREVLEPAHT